jgi:hypothetical protein
MQTLYNYTVHLYFDTYLQLDAKLLSLELSQLLLQKTMTIETFLIDRSHMQYSLQL